MTAALGIGALGAFLGSSRYVSYSQRVEQQSSENPGYSLHTMFFLLDTWAMKRNILKHVCCIPISHGRFICRIVEAPLGRWKIFSWSIIYLWSAIGVILGIVILAVVVHHFSPTLGNVVIIAGEILLLPAVAVIVACALAPGLALVLSLNGIALVLTGILPFGWRIATASFSV